MEHKLISVFDNAKSIYPTSNTNLLNVCTSTDSANQIKLLRQFDPQSEDFRLIKMSLPCFTPSITCTQKGAKYMVSHSHYVCLDWNNISDPIEWKKKLTKLPFISFAALSCSGLGVYAMVRIRYPHLHSHHCKSLLNYFAEMGNPASTSCLDLAALHMVSFDNSPYIKYLSETWSDMILQEPINIDLLQSKYQNNNINERAIFIVRDFVVANEVDITTGKENWYRIATYIASSLGENGKSIFKEISQFHPKFNESEMQNCYTSAKTITSHNGIGVLMDACFHAGFKDLIDLFIKKSR